MLNRNAMTRCEEIGRRSMIAGVSSDAPQSLQKSAPSTTTAFPQCEQNRGPEKNFASGTEDKRNLADSHRVAIL